MTTPTTRPLKVDRDGRPSPQYWNPNTLDYEVAQGVTGALAIAASHATVVFHNAATVAGLGLVFPVDTFRILTIEISGTSTSRSVEFIARGLAGINRPLIGIRLSDFATATNTVTTGEIWQFDITGLSFVLMNLAIVAGGNVTIQGRVVA